jgi:hypothetical protein
MLPMIYICLSLHCEVWVGTLIVVCTSPFHDNQLIQVGITGEAVEEEETAGC